MKIEVGKTYLTSGSQKVLIIYDGLKGDQPFVGVRTRDDGEECLETYSVNGAYYNDGDFSDLDLAAEYREPLVKWLVLDGLDYTQHVGGNKEEAQRFADANGLGFRVVKFVEARE